MRTKNLNRLFSLFLCLIMLLGLVPTVALAGSFTSAIYTGQTAEGAFTGQTNTFAADQSGLILHLDFQGSLSDGSKVASLAFKKVGSGSQEYGTVFWYDDENCTNGTKNDKLDNGVFQLLYFTPNGNGGDLEPGQYNIVAYVSTGGKEETWLFGETYTITGNSGPVMPKPTITTASLPEAAMGKPYNETLQATPGTEGNTLSWSVSSGTLPTGLTLSSTGAITGTPTATGTFVFNVTVTETAEAGTATASKQFTMTVKKLPGPTIITTSLPDAEVDVAYSQTLAATPGTVGDSLSWEITSGALPDGLSLNATTGAITGTPTAAGTSTFTVTVTETVEGGQTITASREFTIKVTIKLAITNDQTSFDLKRGQTFNLPLTANMEGVNWRIISGSLPSGLSLKNGVISGTVASYASAGSSQITVQASADGQTATMDFTFQIGNLFRFELPSDGVDPDAVGMYAYLRAKQGGQEITLWSGKLEADTSMMIPSSFAGATVTVVRLVVYLNGTNNDPTVLADHTDEVVLTDGQSQALTGKGDGVLVTLPEITHSYGNANINTQFKGTDGRIYRSGAVVDGNKTFTLSASAYRSYGSDNPLAEYDFNAPSFSGQGVSDSTYNPANNPSGDPITLIYPKYDLKEVTVTLKQASGTETGTEPNLAYAELRFTQYLPGSTYTVTAEVEQGNTCKVKLYSGVECRVYMTKSGDYALMEETFQATDFNNNNQLELEVYGAEEKNMAVSLTGKPENENLESYISGLWAVSAYPDARLRVVMGDRSYSISYLRLDTKISYRTKTIKIWDINSRNGLTGLLKNGGYLKLTWPDSGPVLAGEKKIPWEEGKFDTSADVTIELRGGVQFDLTTTGDNSLQLQGWWHQENEDGQDVWLAGSKTFVNKTSRTIGMYCPGAEGKWDFILLPQVESPSGMTWAEAVAAYPGFPQQQDLEIKKNTAHDLGSLTIPGRDVDSVLYETLPNSVFTGPAQFNSIGETLVFTGHIELDEGVDKKMTELRLDAAGTDSSGRVSTQISSVVVNGVEYPYAKIQLQEDETEKDTLTSMQFQTYYQIVFSEPVELPCDITVYGSSMTGNSAAVLDLRVKLDDRSSAYQPVDKVIVSAPSVTVDIPNIVGTKTVTARVVVPDGGRVEVYDGIDKVGQIGLTGDIRIALSGAVDSMATSHDLKFVLIKDDKEVSSYEQTVVHMNGMPTLSKQNMQLRYTGYSSWSTIQSDKVYSFTSSNPPLFRATATFDNSENLKDGSVSFAVKFLDGIVRVMDGNDEGKGTFVSEEIATSSPVIGMEVYYEIDWDKVEKFMKNALPLPSDSPTANSNYQFDDTIVLSGADFKDILPTILPEDYQLTEAEEKSLEELRTKVKDIYNKYEGSIDWYSEDEDDDAASAAFQTGRAMTEALEPGEITDGDEAFTFFCRTLTVDQLTQELGNGEGWTRMTFTKPREKSSWGGAGNDGSIGVECYSTQFVTEKGVDAAIHIVRYGNERNDIYEFATASAQGDGVQPVALYSTASTYAGARAGGNGGMSYSKNGQPGYWESGEGFADTGTAAQLTQTILEDVLPEMAENTNSALSTAGDVLGPLGLAKDSYDAVTTAQKLYKGNDRLQELFNSEDFKSLDYETQRRFIQRQSDINQEWNEWGARQAAKTGVNIMGLFTKCTLVGIPVAVYSWGEGKILNQKASNIEGNQANLADEIELFISKNNFKNGKGRTVNGRPYRPCIDPSGIVYEAVLSNPVQGATVTLYTADGDVVYVPQYNKDTAGIEVHVDESGKPVAPKNSYTGNGILTAPDIESLAPQQLTLTTGPDGRYQWMVPAGLWYVTAEKPEDGYVAGSSNEDVAAVVKGKNDRNWLPVLPEQLDVNIPLVSYAIPEITPEYRPDGVYLTFSKYMDDTTLTDGAFQINGKAAEVELLNSEKAPSNIKYPDGVVPSYTSQIKLTVGTLSEGEEVTVTISKDVKSYAGVPCTTNNDGMTIGGVVEEAPPVETPTFSLPGGQVPFGSQVTITCETKGAVLYYTTDGSTPTTDSPRYYPGQVIIVDRNMTIKVLAVKPGYEDAMASAAYTVPGGTGDTPDDQGGSVAPSATVKTESAENGSFTVSNKYAGAGQTVKITPKADEGYVVDQVIVTDKNGKVVEVKANSDGTYSFVMPERSKQPVTIKVTFMCDGGENCPAHGFTDVDQSEWYHKGVDYVVENGLMLGTGENIFSPDGITTRAMVVTILYRLEGEPAVTRDVPFEDVASGQWYSDAVNWAAANEIVGGYGGGKFGPEDTITREQTAVILYRYAGYKGYDVTGLADLSGYTDAVKVSDWAVTAMRWAVDAGLINGTGAATLSPSGDTTRAQVATILMRYCENVVE